MTRLKRCRLRIDSGFTFEIERMISSHATKGVLIAKLYDPFIHSFNYNFILLYFAHA